jgi:hypothetical protein
MIGRVQNCFHCSSQEFLHIIFIFISSGTFWSDAVGKIQKELKKSLGEPIITIFCFHSYHSTPFHTIHTTPFLGTYVYVTYFSSVPSRHAPSPCTSAPSVSPHQSSPSSSALLPPQFPTVTLLQVACCRGGGDGGGEEGGVCEVFVVDL